MNAIFIPQAFHFQFTQSRKQKASWKAQTISFWQQHPTPLFDTDELETESEPGNQDN